MLLEVSLTVEPCLFESSTVSANVAINLDSRDANDITGVPTGEKGAALLSKNGDDTGLVGVATEGVILSSLEISRLSFVESSGLYTYGFSFSFTEE